MATINIDTESIKTIDQVKKLFESLTRGSKEQILLFERWLSICQKVEEVKELDGYRNSYFCTFVDVQTSRDCGRMLFKKWISVCQTLTEAAEFYDRITGQGIKGFYLDIEKLAWKKVEYLFNEYKKNALA